MKKITRTFCILALLCSVNVAVAQEVIAKIEEDYSNPLRDMWVKSDDYCKRTVENGIYTAKSISVLGPQLEFGFDLNQLECEYSNDMEFTIVKLKGSDKSFISIELYPTDYTQLTFHYNATGEWKLTENYNPTIVASGNTTVNPGSNVISIHHRRNSFEYFFNGQKITERKVDKNVKLNWHEIKIYAKDTKMQIGLDKTVLIGYLDELNDKVGLFTLERFSTFHVTSVYDRTDVYIISEGDKKRLMDDRGRLSKQTFDYLTGTYSGNWLIVGNKDKTLFGYIDAAGNEMLPMKYKEVADILCTENMTGCYALKSYKVTGTDLNVYYISPETKVLITEDEAKKSWKPKADLTKITKLFSPVDGMQLVRDKTTNMYGYLNDKDLIVIPLIYSSASLFGNNRAPVTLNGRKIYIDNTGKEVINAEKYQYSQVFYNGYAVVKNDQGMFAFIDTTGKERTGFIYSKADGFSSGLAAVCANNKYGFLGLDLKPAIPLIYQYVGYFSTSGLAHVINTQGKHGYINQKGEYVIPAIYDDGGDDWNLISNNPKSGWPYHTYMVTLNGEKKYLDAEGKDVTLSNSVTGSAGTISNEPSVEIKTKTHTLKVYPGWADIFPNPEKGDYLDSEYGGKKPSEIFKEAPDGWIKSENHLYSLHLRFFTNDSTTLEELKGYFIDLAKNRTGWAKEKIKPVEERITLPDGRKGMILFYVCPDIKGMVGGNYFNCDYYEESKTNKANINEYRIFIEGGNPDLPPGDAVAWKDYFKKVLLSIRPN